MYMPFDTSEQRSQGSVHMDATRGAAAILVMLGHSRDLFFTSLNGSAATMPSPASGMTAVRQAPRPQITMGNEAVMIFFVLSGYLVGGSVLRSFQRNRWSWKDYLTKRLTRLWIVLLPALILTVVFDHVGLRFFPETTGIYQSPVGQTVVPANLIHTLTPRIVAGNGLFLQGILVPTAGTNIALWSLSNEFWYYLIFPLLVFVCWRSSSALVRVGSALLAGALLFFIGPNEAVLFPTWLLGAAISLLPLKLTERTSRWLMTGLSLLLLPVMIVVRQLPLDLRLAQTCIGLYFGVLLYCLLNRNRPARRGLYQRVATVLSDLSYPLYLVHLPILVFLCAAINRPWHHWSKSPANFGLMFAIDATTIVAAYLFHLCFQKHTETVRLALLGRLQQQQHVPVAMR
jgi:peptidoglycan/LPS O-acetylase OafA/YrhL